MSVVIFMAVVCPHGRAFSGGILFSFGTCHREKMEEIGGSANYAIVLLRHERL